MVSTFDSIEFVQIEEILRCEASGAYCEIHLRDGTNLLVSKVIKEFEQLLKDYGFYRVHQSHLVNLREVKKYLRQENCLLLKDNTKINVARSRKEAMFKALESTFQ